MISMLVHSMAHVAGESRLREDVQAEPSRSGVHFCLPQVGIWRIRKSFDQLSQYPGNLVANIAEQLDGVV